MDCKRDRRHSADVEQTQLLQFNSYVCSQFPKYEILIGGCKQALLLFAMGEKLTLNFVIKDPNCWNLSPNWNLWSSLPVCEAFTENHIKLLL